MTIAAGTKLGHYEILSPIGAGGMGEVYRARDSKLDRYVAVKVLPDRVAADEEALSRFEREAKAVAAVSHPNVLAIYDFGTDRGIKYIVTELLEGESLRQRLEHSPIPWRKAVEIAARVADGLAAAHAKGIVHRDLKPENTFLTDDGVVKILDFGLAREQQDSDPGNQTMTLGTRPGTVLGTVSYMSPEQVRGQVLDGRTDIFSLGCVLYEMITGDRVFKGDTSADITTAILTQNPPTVTTSKVDVAPELDRTIARCLEKNAHQRFQSSGDLAFTLRSILADSGPVAPAEWNPRALGFKVPVAIAVLALSVATAYISYKALIRSAPNVRPVASKTDFGRNLDPLTSLGKKVRIAVLPFDDTSPEPQEWFANGMTEAAIDDLQQISGLTVISHTSVKQYRDTIAQISDIAMALNVEYIVEGSVLRDGDRVRINARLLDALTEERIWSERYDGDMSDIIALQHDVAQAIVFGVQVKLTPEEEAQLAQKPRVNTKALQAYMMGLEATQRGTREECEFALTMFDRSLQEDPNFALAYAGRAKAYELLANNYLPPKEAMPKVREAALKALELDDTLAEAHVALGEYKLEYEWDFDGAQKAFKKAIETSPNSATARLGYAAYLSAMNRGDEAIRQLDLVQESDPVARDTDFMFGAVSYMAHNYARTISDAQAALAKNPEWWAAHQWMGLASSQLGHHDVAIHHAREAARINPSPTWLAMAGGILAVAGERDEALEIYDSLKSDTEIEYVCPYELATIPLGLGDHDTTFMEMDRACEARADCLAWLQVDPRLDPIRDDERFDRLLTRVGFDPPGGLKMTATTKPALATLAVLPFEPVSAHPDTEYLKSEIPASIINSLSSLSSLLVIPRSTAFRYVVGDQDTADIGQALGANAVLTGQINIRGNSLVIRAELVDVPTKKQLWSQRYDRMLSDMMAIEEDIATRIAEALLLQITGEEKVQLTKRYTDNADAYQLYLEGRWWWNKRTEDGFNRAISLFDRAVAIDPNYALAYAGKADCLCVIGWYVRPLREVAPKIMEAVKSALALDPLLPEAYPPRAFSHMFVEWDWAAAERDFLRSIELKPSYATAHHWYGLLLTSQGRLEEARNELRLAVGLDPGSLIIKKDLGFVYFMNRQFDQAIEQYRAVLDEDPTFVQARVALASALMSDRRFDEATAEIQRVYNEVGPVPRAAGWIAIIHAAAGRHEQARQELRTLTEQSQSQYIPAITFALIHAELGELDEAFARLDEAVEAREGWLALMAVSPIADALRSDSRFHDLLRRMGLPTSTPADVNSSKPQAN